MFRSFLLTAVFLATTYNAVAQSVPASAQGKVYAKTLDVSPDLIAKCKRNMSRAKAETRDIEQRDKENLLPVTVKFISLDFKDKETIAFCASLKAGNWKEFIPLKLVYVTNYKPYGTYDPIAGLHVNF